MSKDWDELVFKPVRFPLEEEVADEKEDEEESECDTK